MAKINGTDLRVSRNGQVIGYESEFTFSIQTNLPDASNKDSAGFAEHIQGQRSATLEFTAMVDLTADYGIPEALADLIGREDIFISWREVSGTGFYSGKAAYSSLSLTAANEETVSYSGSLTINGDWGYYPDSITRTLRTTNDNTTFQASNVFGVDSLNNFYYVNNSNGDVYRLKNGVETVINADFAAGDFLGFSSTNKSYLGFGDSDSLLTIKSGVDTLSTIPDFLSCDAFFIDGNYLYYTYNDTNVFLSKYDLVNNSVVWATDLGDNASQHDTFQVIKQGTHIVISYEANLSDAWTLEVFNESTGAFIRSVAVVTDADTVGVWMAVLGTTLYIGYGDGTLSYIKKLTFNNTTLTSIANSGTSPIVPIRAFNNLIYVKLGNGGDVSIFEDGNNTSIGIVDTLISNITDFTINNGVLITYESGTTSIKCFAV